MFYDSLQSTLVEIPKQCVLAILVDFNARFADDKTYRERLMERQGTGRMTDNGSSWEYDM